MRSLKAILNVVVLAYVVFSVLLLTTLLNENTLFQTAAENQALLVYKALTGAGAFLLLMRLGVNYLHMASVKHEKHLAQLKINELKAELYEKRQDFRSNSHKQQAVAEEAEAEY